MLKLLDSARPPERPTSPNKQQVLLIALAGGLGLGILLAAVRSPSA